MADFDVDLFVIGGGSGGVRAARIAAGYGARVVVAEEYRVGGTCVIRGCVPKKLMVYASHVHHEIEDAAGFGWTIPTATVRLADADRQQGQGDRAARGHLHLQRRQGRRRHRQGARRVRGSRTRSARRPARRCTAKYVLIATGGAPNHGAAIPGIEHVISSNEVFHLAKLPKRIVIQGGGYIALEFACIFAGLGSDVTLVYRGDNILRGFDEDVRAHVRDEMEKHGITILTGCTVDKVEKHGDEFTSHLSNGSSVASDQVMFAIGRHPERRQPRPGEGRRRHQSGQRRHRGRRLLADLGAAHLRGRRRHRPHQPDAGGDPRGPRLRRHRVRQAADAGRLTPTFRPPCSRSRRSAPSA